MPEIRRREEFTWSFDLDDPRSEEVRERVSAWCMENGYDPRVMTPFGIGRDTYTSRWRSQEDGWNFREIIGDLLVPEHTLETAGKKWPNPLWRGVAIEEYLFGVKMGRGGPK